MIKKKHLVLIRALTVIAVVFCWIEVSADDTRYRRSVERYSMPDVVLVNQNGVKVPFRKYLETDKPVILDFIYGTCTTICPVLSAGYVNLQRKLGADTLKVRLVSITIDPENDTPKVMKDYLKKYRAKPGWDFFTGSRADIDKVMRAFNAYIPDKMSHYQLTLIRSPRDGSWVRVMGLMSSTEMMNEYTRVIAK